MINLDLFFILKWFFGIFAIGVAFLPVSFVLFKNFKDKGYIFSKIIGIAFLSYFIFLLGFSKIVKFSEFSVYLSLILFFILNYSVFLYKKNKISDLFKNNLRIFVAEEVIFLLTLLFWCFVRGNLPEINGLEKFMDFGFLNSILRTDYFPPKDMWYTPLPINYYYFGHLVTAVLTKLTLIPSFMSYNLMLATLFAFTFTASFSIGINLFDNLKFSVKSTLSGFISAVLIALGGNLTTVYAFFKAYMPMDQPVPFWQLPFLPLSFSNGYWSPNATRFIPFTIHEFPLYSFVVSDLHGHVLDIPFVLLTIAILFSFFVSKKINTRGVVLISFLLGIMYMTNAWDGLIYLLLAFIFFTVFSFYQNGLRLIKKEFIQLLKTFITLVVGFFAFSLPFSLHFKPFASGIGVLCAPAFLTKLTHLGPFLFEADHCQRSPLWQIVILYGFFYFFVISFLLFLKFKKKHKFSKNEIFVLILIGLSTFLIIVPEFLYIKDIYPAHYRANTMFKLVYEAFMLLSLCTGFIIVKLISEIKNKKILIPFFITSALLISLVLIYPFFAINSYYRDLKTYEGLDGTRYLQNSHPEDYKLINWLNENVKGQPIILEASGDSYTDYARISANTGLPTLIGWSVHEWLWRGTYDIVGPRVSDAETLYTSEDVNAVKGLISEYNISYIVVSDLEREKYPKLSEKVFETIGKLIYASNQTRLYKIN